ncbi:MAG: rhodanese-like domain-containing protein [Acidimicrobiales bacterium]
MPSPVERLLAEVRAGLELIGPAEAAARQAAGALLVDIRPVELRAAEGQIPGAIVVDRNVLEWRLEPDGAHRHPDAGPSGRPVVVFCQEGYASGLAVASLQQLGLTRVSDLDGGFAAWRAAGLPVSPGPAA